ncbi:hypothetical protein FD723_40445 (plasmid) [Nostoc sp. C052]|uniref:hypothetical protein n=1 Tax=Nostoc sp. C052 TaxID=2576902 RepID=UPI0015C2DC67|nr:hypothetical protein [Nostoc sp. C052]QLE46484.1 hypothetical protein FD723_40445 [Nostoc sp. C052]
MLNQHTGQEAIKFVISDIHGKILQSSPSYHGTTYLVAKDGGGKKILSLSLEERAETIYFIVEFSGETRLMAFGFHLSALKCYAQDIFNRALTLDFQDFDPSLQENAQVWAEMQKTSFDYPEFKSANLFAKYAFDKNHFLILGDKLLWTNNWAEEDREDAPKWSMSFFTKIPSLASKACMEWSSLADIYPS